jgi:hypothetical protein
MNQKQLQKGQALSELVLLVVMVLAATALVMTLTGSSFDSTVGTATGTLDRSFSGVTGGALIVQTAYRPSAVAVASPNNGSDTNTGVAAFTWQPNASMDGVDRYKVTLQKYVDLGVLSFWIGIGSKQARCGVGLGCTSTQLTLPFGGNYRWKVSAHNAAGWGTSDGMHYFTAR